MKLTVKKDRGTWAIVADGIVRDRFLTEAEARAALPAERRLLAKTAKAGAPGPARLAELLEGRR